jgi:predicted esterase
MDHISFLRMQTMGSLTRSIHEHYEIISKEHDIHLEPKSGDPRATLIFLHGLGDSAQGRFQTFLEEQLFPSDTRIILLTAPMVPVTIHFGKVMNSWFDIHPHSQPRKYNINDVMRSQKRVLETIEKEIKFHNDNPSKVFLGGFSQGAAMSMHIGLEYKRRLGGVIAASGFLLEDTKFIQKDLNLLIVHGTDDEVIPLPVAQMSYMRALKLPNATFKVISGLTHSINLDVVNVVRQFAQSLIK